MGKWKIIFLFVADDLEYNLLNLSRRTKKKVPNNGFSIINFAVRYTSIKMFTALHLPFSEC